MSNFISIMALLGFVTWFSIAMFFVSIACDRLGDFIANKRYVHKYKHRFDKPPKAKCYCIDCVSYRDEYCHLHRFRIADNWFCRNAMPRDREEKKND